MTVGKIGPAPEKGSLLAGIGKGVRKLLGRDVSNRPPPVASAVGRAALQALHPSAAAPALTHGVDILALERVFGQTARDNPIYFLVDGDLSAAWKNIHNGFSAEIPLGGETIISLSGDGTKVYKGGNPLPFSIAIPEGKDLLDRFLTALTPALEMAKNLGASDQITAQTSPLASGIGNPQASLFSLMKALEDKNGRGIAFPYQDGPSDKIGHAKAASDGNIMLTFGKGGKGETFIVSPQGLILDTKGKPVSEELQTQCERAFAHVYRTARSAAKTLSTLNKNFGQTNPDSPIAFVSDEKECTVWKNENGEFSIQIPDSAVITLSRDGERVYEGSTPHDVGNPDGKLLRNTFLDALDSAVEAAKNTAQTEVETHPIAPPPPPTMPSAAPLPPKTPAPPPPTTPSTAPPLPNTPAPPPPQKPLSTQEKPSTVQQPQSRPPSVPQAASLGQPTFQITPELRAAFSVDSATLQTDPAHKNKVLERDLYRSDKARGRNLAIPPAVIGKSAFVPDSMVEVLMKEKAHNAGGGVKYTTYGEEGSRITPMEGLLHTYATAIIGDVRMCGDCYYAPEEYTHHQRAEFGPGKFRPVVLSTAIHPDCETDGTEPPTQSIFLRLAEITDEGCQGAPLSADFRPLSKEDRENPQKVGEYDKALLQHAVYNLTSEGKRISKGEITQTLDASQAEEKIKELLASGKSPDQIRTELRTMAVELDGTTSAPGDEFATVSKPRLLSMEILYNSYVEQLQNEFGALEKLSGEGGYVYTIDPPSIFARRLGKDGSHMLNLFQCLALRSAVLPNVRHMKEIWISGAPNEQTNMASFYNTGGKTLAVRKIDRQDPSTHLLSVPKGTTIILHNNSDAFYDNLGHEPPGGSLDGIVGDSCNAYLGLDSTNPDILKRVISTPSLPKPTDEDYF